MEETSAYDSFSIKELKEELKSQKEELEYHQSIINDINKELGRRKVKFVKNIRLN